MDYFCIEMYYFVTPLVEKCVTLQQKTNNYLK